MRIILLLSLLSLASCNSSSGGKSGGSQESSFISFQENTTNFHLHTGRNTVEAMTYSDYLSLRNTLPIYERGGYTLNMNGDVFWDEVKTYPNSVTLCKDHSNNNVPDLECRVGVW